MRIHVCPNVRPGVKHTRYVPTVCTSDHHHIIAEYSMDKPGKIANPARGQLNRENSYSLVPVRAWQFGLARRVQPSRPASACSLSILRLNMVLTHGIPPDFRAMPIYLFKPPYAIGSVPRRSGHAIAHRWRSLLLYSSH